MPCCCSIASGLPGLLQRLEHEGNAVILSGNESTMTRPEAIAALEELIFRFRLVCQDMDGKTDSADLKRIKRAEAAVRVFKKVGVTT
jgi:hypothetical protein